MVLAPLTSLNSSKRFIFQQYEEWKKNLPDTEWMKSLIPDVELDKFRSNLIKVGESIKGKANEIDIGEKLRSLFAHLSPRLFFCLFCHCS